MVIEHSCGRGPVDDAVVDLVGDHDDPTLRAGRSDLGERFGVEHGSSRVRRRGEHESIEVPGSVEVGGGRCPSALGADRDRHRFDAECQERVAVTGVPGLEHTDAIAGFEQREEGEGEAGRRACDDDDPLGSDAVVAVSEPPPQRVQSGGVGIAEWLVEVGPNCCSGGHRQWRRWLADLQVKDASPRNLERCSLASHRHCMKRRYSAGAERSLDHSPIIALRPVRTRHVIRESVPPFRIVAQLNRISPGAGARRR